MMLPPKVILLIGEDGEQLQSMFATLNKRCEVIHFDEAAEEIRHFAPLAVVLYQNGDTRRDTLQQLERLKVWQPSAPVLLCTSGNSKEAITATPKGVDERLDWPTEADKLLAYIKKRLSWPTRLWQGVWRHRAPARKSQRATTDVPANGMAEAPLKVYSFGGLRLELNGQKLPALRSEADQAILACLLLEKDRRVMRHRLLTGFWPNSQEDSARNCLNVSISHLRRYLREELGEEAKIHFRDNSYELQLPCRLHFDAEALLQLKREGQAAEQSQQTEAAVEAYHSMARLYQGAFLENLRREIDWVEATRDRMQEIYLAALDRMGELLLEMKQYKRCILATEKVLRIDNCIESAHRRIMTAYAGLGKRSRAIRQYQVCEKILGKELGVEPTETTKQLCRKLKGS
jgi:DNA-binding SARP family transcriptional activator